MTAVVPGAMFHGGVPFLNSGDIIEPGHERKLHDGCPWCAARARGEVLDGIDAPSAHDDRVYFTTDRLYAKHYASLWGRGDLYRVEPIGDVWLSTEDTITSFTTPQLRVLSVLDRAVQLTMNERRRLFRAWTAADNARKELTRG